MTDEELILKYKKDNAVEAIGILYKRYAHLVLGLGLKFTKDKENAKEGVSEIFETILIKLKDHNVINFKAWLYKVSKNHFMASQKALAKHRVVSLDEKKETKGDFFMENDIRYALYTVDDDSIELEEKEEAVRKAVHTLKEEQRRCIELFFFKKMTYAEIAMTTGYDLKQVKSYVQNGKRNVKIALMNKLYSDE